MQEQIKVVPVIKVTCQIGNGSAESPFRTGIEYRDLNGKVLFITEAEYSGKEEFISAEFQGRRETQVPFPQNEQQHL